MFFLWYDVYTCHTVYLWFVCFKHWKWVITFHRFWIDAGKLWWGRKDNILLRSLFASTSFRALISHCLSLWVSKAMSHCYLHSGWSSLAWSPVRDGSSIVTCNPCYISSTLHSGRQGIKKRRKMNILPVLVSTDLQFPKLMGTSNRICLI